MTRQSCTLTPSMENYIKTIAYLKREHVVARVKDISKKMKVKSSSVSVALDLLAEKGIIVHQKYGYVDLTPQGEKQAEEIEKRHQILLHFLHKILQIEETKADTDACAMEHYLSSETYEKLTRFISHVENCSSNYRWNWFTDTCSETD